jgi:hypothetical protein
MTVEELLAKKISDEIDVEILTKLFKGIGMYEKEIEEYANNFRKNSEDALEREILGGKNKIHGAKE